MSKKFVIIMGQEAGLRCSFDLSKNKWTFGLRSLLYQEFRRRLGIELVLCDWYLTGFDLTKGF